MMTREKTTGNILKKLVAFSVPLILSGLFQQLFNWVDALIVGNFVGETALAGVGAVTSLYNLFVTTIVGFTSGLSVLFARQYGQGERDGNADLLASYSVILTAVFAMISVLGMVFISPILDLMDTPKEIFLYARDYLLIIFIGIPFLALYNVYSAVLRGMGNSKTPFIAVLISSVTNAVLDYVLIAVFDLGVGGAAVATVISQVAMTVYIIIYTVAKYPSLRFSPLRSHRNRNSIRSGAGYGMPPAIQSSVSSVGNLILQRFMNGFGEQTVAAITTAYRVDTVLLLPIVNFSSAISTLVAQEAGAGSSENPKKIFRLGILMMSAISVVLAGIIFFFGRAVLSIFGLGAESVVIGERFFRTLAMFYVFNGLFMSIRGYLEGMSDLLFSGIAGICSLGVRIACSYAFADVWGNMVVAYAEAFSWIFLVIVYAWRYYAKGKKL